MIRLGPLYHWSPLDRRDAILRDGLVPGERSTSGSSAIHVCLAPSPRGAWLLSGDTDWGGETDDWDLWEVVLAEQDELRVRTDWGPRIVEVKVHNVIPPDRVWWVGQRQPWLT